MRWVLIETGSNQPYIFGTNKQRLQLAASREVRLLGDNTIPEVAQELNEARPGSVRHVVQASGTGMLLVDSEETGRELVRRVTEHALRRRSGLDVWGYVHDQETDDASAAKTLPDAQRKHGLARSGRLSPLLQAINSPFEQQCSLTGRPAVPYDDDGTERFTGQFRSLPVKELWASSERARIELGDLLKNSASPAGEAETVPTKDVLDRALVSWARLKEGKDIRNNGWVGVLHADGNGVGSVFSNLALADGIRFDGQEQSFLDLETRLSQDLSVRMWRVVGDTIVQCHQKYADDLGTELHDWVLPIIIGGDDVTVVLHGAMAWRFTRRLIDNFARSFAKGLFPAVLSQIRGRLTGASAPTLPSTLTLGAGLVFVKPHHPFSHAIDVAEQLASSAKRWCKPYGGVDVEVLFESAVRDLSAIREDQVTADGGFARFGGPFLVSAEPDDAIASTHPRHVRHLDEVLVVLASGGMSRRAVHSIREAINATTDSQHLATVLKLAFERLKARADASAQTVVRLEQDVTATVDRNPRAALGGGPTGSTPDQQLGFTRIMTALDLLDVEQGTAASRTSENARPQPAEDER